MKPHPIRRYLPGLLLAPGAAAQTALLDVPGTGGTKLLQLNDDAGLVAKGSFGTGVIPVTGVGVRLMWYPGKAAFRAGSVDATQWNDANVGDYSVAMGFGTTASGFNSTAMGSGTEASGNRSTAMGFGTTASGFVSTAMGSGTEASGNRSTAMGINTTASGSYTTAMGLGATAQAYASLVLGQYNVIAGNAALWVSTDPVLVVGNGSFGSPSNALTLLKNGDLTIAGTLTELSDRRLKRDIHPLTDARDGLARLRPVRFRFRAGTSRPEGMHIGLIAQEVAEVFPELVRRGSDGYWSVSYANLSAVLVQALNEQQAEITEQQAEMEAQQAALDALRAEVAALRAAIVAPPAPAAVAHQ